MITSRPFLPARAAVARWDRGALVLLLAFVLLLPIWTPRLYATDSVQYYAYLRSLFFDGDLDFRNEYAQFHALNPTSGIDRALLPWRDDEGTLRNVDPTTGRLVNVAPVGSAILWSPAFLVAHGIVVVARALGSDSAADGYSLPYIWAISAASAVYGLLGLLLAYRIARRFVTAWPATIATLLCWLASPLVFYMYISPPWSHTASLFATALFISYWLHTKPDRSLRQWLILGLLGGLMVLTREQLGLFLLLPALEALRDYWQIVRERRWRDLPHSIAIHALFLAVFLLALTPQLATYLVLNGHLGPSQVVLDKIAQQPPDTAGFGLPGSAHFFDTLIDIPPSPETGRRFAHGALLWSPVWALALVGLALLWRRDRWLTALLATVFAAQVWVNGSFGTTWHLSGAFGFRRLTEATPIFVLGLALLIDRARLPRPAWMLIGAVLIAWNVGLIYQWTVLGGRDRQFREGLVWDGMIERQFAAPAAVVRQLDQLLFNRCELVENGQCR